MKKINILYITHSPIIGGAEVSLASHLKEIDKSKFNVYLAASSLMKPLVQDIKGVQFIQMEFFLLYRLNPQVLVNFIKMVLNLVRIVRQNNIDIIHTSSVKAHYIGTMAALITSRKLVWWIRDTTFNRLLYHLLHTIPQSIISVSNYIKEYYIPESKNVVIYNGVATPLQTPSRLVLGHGRFVIGCVERLVRWKGVQNLISAYAPLVKEFPNTVLMIVGTGKNQAEDVEDDLKKMVKRAKIESQVIFLGWQDDPDQFMKQFDVLVHPPIEPEPFGLVVVEAMMLKVLVLCSNIGGPTEFIEDGKNGLLFEAGNTSSLRDKLKLILEKKINIQKIVNNAYQFATSNLSQQKETRAIENLYFQLLHY